MIQASRPEDGVARPDGLCFAVGATQAHKATARDDDKDDVVGGAVFIKGGMRIKIHGFHLHGNVEQEWQAIDTPGKIFPLLWRHKRAVHLNGHAIDP